METYLTAISEATVEDTAKIAKACLEFADIYNVQKNTWQLAAGKETAVEKIEVRVLSQSTKMKESNYTIFLLLTAAASQVIERKIADELDKPQAKTVLAFISAFLPAEQWFEIWQEI